MQDLIFSDMYNNLHFHQILRHAKPVARKCKMRQNLLTKRKLKNISLQCRRILGGRNLFRVRNIVVAGIFDFMTVEDWGEYK